MSKTDAVWSELLNEASEREARITEIAGELLAATTDACTRPHGYVGKYCTLCGDILPVHEPDCLIARARAAGIGRGEP